ncbi:SSU ribosomal protein S3AE [Methanothermus fervidus DSM 2088]|uniref:Small ribosomal subunit protein eS1 n=1 Tax=Methanothermus fervidus (strain ATCC 43054 / DSM 2088 / JCM 10308 / V24 S) TaxID=523846 RepID=E3GXA4_METFV|nr:30S ribosomal protein S3ae [Methanothermus fervidus]ADP76936.1 SSU ribosomal protein S3AE [Methanothermus fervidus DSM 2088]
MARVRRRRARDTWKEKKWYTILSPKYFGEKEIGLTPARSPDLVVNRTVEATVRELTGDFSKQYMKLKFRINDVTGDVAKTKYIGHEMTTDYVRSLIRRGTSRVDAPVIVNTKDGYKIKVYTLIITARRTKTSQQREIRRIAQEKVLELAAERTLEEFIKDMIDGKISSEVQESAKVIYPIRRVEIIKTKVLSEPEEK